MDFQSLFSLADEDLCQALLDKFTRTDLLLLSRSCGLRLKGNPAKLTFASEILRDMRAFYLERADIAPSALREMLDARYERAFKVLWSIRAKSNKNINEYHRQRRVDERRAALDIQKTSDEVIKSAWPTEVTAQVCLDSCTDYYTASQWKPPQTCACCVRAPRTVPVAPVHTVPYMDALAPIDWEILRLNDPFLLARCADDFRCPSFHAFDGIMLDHSLMTFDVNDMPLVSLCEPCQNALTSGEIPKYSMKDDSYRGQLPDELLDLTWLEEKVCARYCTTAQVTRLFQKKSFEKPSGDIDSHPFMLYGNTCAFELNTLSTANVLPRTPADINGLLAIIAIGPGAITKDDLRGVFRVRKAKIMAFLRHLKANHCDYADVVISDEHAALYAEDDIPTDLLDHVTHDKQNDTMRIFRAEAAGLQEHPAELLLDEHDPLESNDTFLEATGVIDPDGQHIAGRMYTASALRNLYRNTGAADNLGSSSSVPLVLARGSVPINEYRNPQLFPGMFPKLFPLGRGGFESPLRSKPISFQTQASYFFDLADRSFCRHSVYPFVVLNHIQHRSQHLNTYFTVRRSNFDSVAKDLIGLDKDIISSVADHLEKEHNTTGLSDEQKKVFGLLSKVNTIASRVPGSEAAKIRARNDAYAMSGYIGISDMFMTINCDPLHAPLFQVMFGDDTVDLSQRYPTMPSSQLRARRIAQDPVAAADFFEFCIRIFFEHLLGWDFTARQSSARGGVLGHLRAYFGTVESTKRMRLHGHFLLWLKGSMNPAELHRRLESDEDFRARYFRFWDTVIMHHLPDFEYEMPREIHPGTQRPPKPGCNDWDEVFVQELKLCGEKFQRHPVPCKPVCHSYGNDDKCRFGFPHEVVETSHYDAATRSVVMRCLDPMVNYFNPYILVMCRHNMDLKTIQSGKAAKGAIYYSTDYMTKGDMRTYETLSLLSRAVARIRPFEGTVREKGKKVLHVCVSQLTREQQISGQQAARYIRGLTDVFASHKTVPMLSSAILARVKREIVCCSNMTLELSAGDDSDKEQTLLDKEVSGDASDNDEEYEPVIVSINQDGGCSGVSQIEDFWFKDEQLCAMVFYDFIRFVKKAKKGPQKDSPERPRLGRARRYCLRPPHPQHDTHELIQHMDPENLVIGEELIPRPVGCSIPRLTSVGYAFFMMCHFAPCGMGQALILPEDSPEVFENYPFAEEHCQIMRNWEALNECEDERDADRLRKRMTKSKGSKVLNALFEQGLEDLDGTVLDLDALTASPATLRPQDAKSADVLRQLTHAGYFTSVERSQKAALGAIDEAVRDIPSLTKRQLKQWDESVKEQEASAIRSRRVALDPTIEMGSMGIKATIQLNNTSLVSDVTEADPNKPVPATVPLTSGNGPAETAENLINRIADEMRLNERQDIAFRIAATYFVTVHAHKLRGVVPAPDFKPLRMFLTGPGGTGKTWVIKALKNVMTAYGCAHRIRLLAPTGSAAALIDGMTIHKGLGITIQKKENGKGNRDVGESKQNYSLIMSPKKAEDLRAEWRDVWITVLDEISMVSSETFCDFDQSLQYALEVKSWFADLGLIVAGDSFQLPPVGGQSLYMPITSRLHQNNREVKRRLGRMAYKTIDTVVELYEQQRMKGDPTYADAVQRLRKRVCTADDVQLFNSRVVASAFNPDGLSMSTPESSAAVAIVATNLLRETINSRKAIADTSSNDAPDLVLSAANDTVDSAVVAGALRENLLRMNANGISEGALPGIIPFFEGMPVILRSRNISTELKITNGGQGVVRKIQHSTDASGHTIVHCLIIEFPLSTVELPGLPRGWFPIRPVKWTFTVKMPNSSDEEEGRSNGKVRVSRLQVPVQPAFAVTGHSAQGKTLPAVLLDMRGGGFHAYVGASRPTSREGLFLIHPITINDLNARLPHDLIVDTRRLDALAHNTLVRYGFLDEPLADVPDPEGEGDVLFTDHVPEVSWPSADEKVVKVKPKRKADADFPLPAPKVPKLTRKLPQPSPESLLPRPPLIGSIWDANNWSCAYDVFFTAFVSVYFTASSNWRTAFSSEGTLSNAFADCMERLRLKTHDTSIHHENACIQARDELRDALSALWPVIFVRHGPVFASTDLLFEKFRNNQSMSQVYTVFTCGSCSALCQYTDTLGCYLHEQSWNRHAARLGLDVNATSASIETWVRVMMSSRVPRPCECGASRDEWTMSESSRLSNEPPLWLSFNCNDQYVHAAPLPSLSFSIPRTDGRAPARYRLRSMIYLGTDHYTSRLFLEDGTIWTYDGRISNGHPVFEMLLLPGAEFPRHRFVSLRDRRVTDLLYVRVADG